MISVNKNKLSINYNDFAFEQDIFEYLELNDTIILLLLNMPLNKKQIDNNVLAYNKKGERIWQIQDAQEVYNMKELDLFVHIGVDKLSRLFATTFCGIVYYLDPVTGKILDRSFTK